MYSNYDSIEQPFSTSKSHHKYPSTFFKLLSKCIIGLAVLVSFYMIASRTDLTKTVLHSTNFAENDVFTITMSASSPDYGILTTLADLPWDMVLEPHRTQNVAIDSFLLGDKEMDVALYTVTWDFAGQAYSGSDIQVMLNNTGVYNCTITITQNPGRRLINTLSPSLSSPTAYTQTFTAAVKYVRREIRSLTDADRELYFDALEQIYSLDETTGQSIYGSKFHSAEYFSYKHLSGAGTSDCDHWHDGAGIITHHMAFTLEFEQSLQSVHPEVAAAYWEYGMDTYLYDTWSESPIFWADWFGESSPTNKNHAINDGGKWAGITVPDGDPYTLWSIPDTGSLNPYVNAFGHMRSPWNNNPVKALGRHNQTYGMTQYGSMPTCQTLQSCFQSDSLADINDCSNGATHGPVHILIGGAWGDGNLFDDPDISMVQKPDKLLFFKVLWRMGYTRCPDSCELGSLCKCSVPQQYIDTYGAEYILKDTNVYYALEKELENADDELFLKVLRAVEDPGIAGEMFSSAAAIDPSFWPLHGQIERLLGAKRIMISQGTITNFDETWAFTEYNKASGAAYLNGVCDWSKVAGSGDLTLPTCTMDTICSGHLANDVLEFSGFLNTGDTYTNQEFYDFIHPWTNDLPYTYDTWDFDYCAEQGYSFTDTTSSNTMLPHMNSGTMLPPE
uniref:Tyrosinase copper-binding domain-containing protein n=1 Tax=viral metagenome TaxID=1070528 RepID=A0A6C0KH90_9ZZZZ